MSFQKQQWSIQDEQCRLSPSVNIGLYTFVTIDGAWILLLEVSYLQHICHTQVSEGWHCIMLQKKLSQVKLFCLDPFWNLCVTISDVPTVVSWNEWRSTNVGLNAAELRITLNTGVYAGDVAVLVGWDGMLLV